MSGDHPDRARRTCDHSRRSSCGRADRPDRVDLHSCPRPRRLAARPSRRDGPLTPQNPRVYRLGCQFVQEITRNQQVRTSVSEVLTKSFPRRSSHEKHNLKSGLRARNSPSRSAITCDHSTVITIVLKRCAVSKYRTTSRVSPKGNSRSITGSRMLAAIAIHRFISLNIVGGPSSAA